MIERVWISLVCFTILYALIDDDWKTYKNRRMIIKQPVYWILGLIGILSFFIP